MKNIAIDMLVKIYDIQVRHYLEENDHSSNPTYLCGDVSFTFKHTHDRRTNVFRVTMGVRRLKSGISISDYFPASAVNNHDKNIIIYPKIECWMPTVLFSYLMDSNISGYFREITLRELFKDKDEKKVRGIKQRIADGFFVACRPFLIHAKLP